MTAVKTKRKRKKMYAVAWLRPVGEFRQGERKMIRMGTPPLEFKDKKAAMRAMCRDWKKPHTPFAYRKGFTPKGVVELEVFPENYSGE